MDPEIEELKEELQEQRKIVEDTNRVVHKMRRAARWGMALQVVWWLSIIGITGAVYYYFVWPYVEQVQALYGGATNFPSQVQDFFNQYFGTTTGR